MSILSGEALAAAAHAQLIPAGGEIAVNTYTSGLQLVPSVCATAGGGFVVAFEDIGLTPGPAPQLAPGRDGDGLAIVARRFGADATPAGSEFVVNAYTSGDQTTASIACNTDGGFLITWRDAEQPPGTGREGIYARAYDDAGQPRGAPFQVDFGPYPQAFPASHPAACSVGGEFVVVWTASQQYVIGRRFAADGTPQGTAIVPDEGAVGPDGSACCATADGFAIVWNGYGNLTEGDATDVRMQRFSSSGVPSGSELIVNTYTLAEQQAPAIACNASGGLVAAWTSSGGQTLPSQDGDAEGVFAQAFDTAGESIGPELQVNTYTTGAQTAPAVVLLADGRYVAAWESPQPSTAAAILARAFDADTTPAGDDTRANVVDVSTSSPAIAALENGEVVVVWQKAQNGSDIAVRRFALESTPTTTLATTTTTKPTSTTSTTVATTTTTTTTKPASTTTTTANESVCGDPVPSPEGGAESPTITAADALFVLRAGVGSESCAACVCDADGSGSVSAVDALVVLRIAVGIAEALDCPPC